MLLRLLVRNFAIVDSIELEFAAGFGALTGETGAGKSILVDALSLALGERADAGVVRVGAAKAEVMAEFDCVADSPVAAWLQDNDIEGDSVLLRRVVDSNGRSRAWINGVAATLGQLRQAAALLCDIHGQHAHHQLLRSEAQRELLDAHADAIDLGRETAQRHGAWRKLREARAAAEENSERTARERELLEWQVRELAALDFDPDEWRATEQEQQRLAHAASLIDASAAALVALDAGGDAAPLAALHSANARLGELTACDSSLGEAAELLNGALIQLDEAASALRRYHEHLETDPARVAELDQRIDAVTQMARKHRVAVDDLPQLRQSLQAQLDAMQQAADSAALAEAEAEARQAYLAVAGRLSAARSDAAARLGAAVSEAMQTLAMDGGRLEIILTPLAQGGPNGLEEIEFQVSGGAGQPLRPLARVASGGELSRIGLALQVIASEHRTAGVLIFDEVDVGIGGRVAEIVGRMLKRLAAGRQVLCVTHLAQVAVCADWQWSISKQTRGEETCSSVVALDAAARIDEIARMLGGVQLTDTTRQHAREMLTAAAS